MMEAVLKPSERLGNYVPDLIYWNSFQAILDFMNGSISGNSAEGSIHFIKRRYGVRKKALSVSCGNGWLERDFFNVGAIETTYGFDVIPNLIETAEEEAEKSDFLHAIQ